MEFFLDFLPIIIYILLIILISVCICFIIKAIKIADKVEVLLEEVETKLGSLNTIFNILNFANEKIGMIGEKIFNGIMSAVHKLFHKRKDDENE